MSEDEEDEEGRFAFTPFKKAVRGYVRGDSSKHSEPNSYNINPRLDARKTPTAIQHKTIKDLDKAIETSRPINKDITLHRGAEVDYIKHNKPVRSYMSAASDEDAAAEYTGSKGGTLYKIKVPRGSKLLRAKEHGQNHFFDGDEHIFPRGSSFSRGKEYEHPDMEGTKVVELKYKGKK